MYYIDVQVILCVNISTEDKVTSLYIEPMLGIQCENEGWNGVRGVGRQRMYFV